jgi:hypothetical protein
MSQAVPRPPVSFDLKSLGELAKSPVDLLDWLRRHLPQLVGPTIDSFTPAQGQRGTVLTIDGANFSTARTDNAVTVGGAPAFVLAASPTSLTVLTGADTDTGPIEVTIGGRAATSMANFVVTGYPDPGDTDDGPPVVTQGAGDPQPGDVNPIGTVRVLVVMLRSSDTTPPNPASVRSTVSNAWDNVHTYYDQVSYGRTNVTVDLTDFAVLDGTLSTFLDTSINNFSQSQLGRIAAIGADAAVKQGFTLNDYAMAAFVVYTNGAFVRAWGGGSQSTFAYDNGLPANDPNRISINIPANHPINTLFINESANWGRFAHEFGHNIVSAPSSSGDGTATLGEDVYGSDLVEPSAATAALFELMGAHDTHPIFSGYHLDKLGYYQSANIRELTWNRNPFSQTFDLIAHEVSQNTTSSRMHLLKIKVSDALTYYIEVRQRPGTTTQIFDDQIPLGSAPNQGGVIVTRAIAGVMHNNQQTRFITLMHDPRVLHAGETAEDPARALKITVVDDGVQARPLVCRVRVEWAQTIADDPNGSFDLAITPWDSHWQSPDLWVDRDPFGTFDSAPDSQGRPGGNGDKPQVDKINHFIARINVTGAMGASNVKVTHYAVTPPGVGDNGNWAPISVQTIGSIAASGHVDVSANWVPVVGKHTCLKAYASAQFGEISGHNNSAQENVFDFISAGNTPCDPVLVRTAIRNPVEERRPVFITVHGVPRGWSAQIPHAWVWLDGLAEHEIDVAIWPEADSEQYAFGRTDKDRDRLPGTAPVRVEGFVPRQYNENQPPADEPPGSWFAKIGGVFYQVHVRRRSSIKIGVDRAGDASVIVAGETRPAAPGQRIVVDVSAPSGHVVSSVEVSTTPNGTFQARMDLRKVVARFGAGTYTVQASIIDADELDDAESNVVQVTF